MKATRRRMQPGARQSASLVMTRNERLSGEQGMKCNREHARAYTKRLHLFMFNDLIVACAPKPKQTTTPPPPGTPCYYYYCCY